MPDQTIRTMFAEARAALDAATRRADCRTVGQVVRYPRLNGDDIIDGIGTITHIECATPHLPLRDRSLTFTVADQHDGHIDRFTVSVGYTGLIPV